MSQLPMLYSVSQTGSITEWEVFTDGPAVTVRWGQQGGVKQINTTISLPKNVGKRNATTAGEQAVKDAKSKWDKQKRKKYHESLEAAESFDGYKPMLAHTYEDHKHKLTFPVLMQPKLDGLRALAYWRDGRVVLQSRGNKEYDLPHIKQAVEPTVRQGVVLDGEIYAHDVGLQSINSLARKPRAESTILQYWVYDQINQDRFVDRSEDVASLVADLPGTVVQRVPVVPVNNEAHIKCTQEYFVSKGFEGAMVRTYSCPYKQGGRSAELLKVKNWLDAEYPVVGCKEGKDGLPVFVCSVPDGRTFDVRPKGTEAERLKLLKDADSFIGKMMTVKYFDLTDEGLPHFGVGLGIREEE
jgi:DNA ligase 1